MIARRSMLPAVAAFLVAMAWPCASDAGTLVFLGSQSGAQTLDEGEGGGNPFASALIELLAEPNLPLAALASELQRRTQIKSRGFQLPDVPRSIDSADATLAGPHGEPRRIALVMVVADYAKAEGAQSLPGARHDAERIARALVAAGFETETAVDLSLGEMRAALAAFQNRSQSADLALIYATGHGVEVAGRVYLLPGDYPVSRRAAALSTRALALAEVAAAPAARRHNLVFYGGCRDNPFAP